MRPPKKIHLIILAVTLVTTVGLGGLVQNVKSNNGGSILSNLVAQKQGNQEKDEVNYTHSLPVAENFSFISPLAEVFGEVSVGKKSSLLAILLCEQTLVQPFALTVKPTSKTTSSLWHCVIT